ncbi:hypothetical protein X728_04025 [Mesorhizobium sp. L103C120A0]|nr:hypothetical protein X728_04025 [Mesorhizobium sp. L103C120A0]
MGRFFGRLCFSTSRETLHRLHNRLCAARFLRLVDDVQQAGVVEHIADIEAGQLFVCKGAAAPAFQDGPKGCLLVKA